MIDPERLRRRLSEVWTALGDEVMRACALTLVAVVDPAAGPEEAARTLAELMPEHPSRAVIIRLEDGPPDLLDADVEAQCWMPFGQRRQICSEQIVIRCSDQTFGEVPAVVLPLVVPDLPVVVWCASRRAWLSSAFPNLAASAGRVIADSAAIPEAFGAAGVADLAWTRLTRWRALLAQVFDNEVYRRRILEFSSLAIRHEGTRSPAALLFAGWLASCLAWDDDRLRAIRFETTGDDGVGRLLGFDLAGGSARVSVHRTGDACGQVLLEASGQKPVQNRVSLAPSTDRLLLEEELSIQAPDPVFDQSRRWALRLAEIRHERSVV